MAVEGQQSHNTALIERSPEQRQEQNPRQQGREHIVYKVAQEPPDASAAEQRPHANAGCNGTYYP